MIRISKQAVTVALSFVMVASSAGILPNAGISSAAAKNPALASNSGTQLIGTSKTVKIKNVTKKTVRKLTVKSSDKSVASVMKTGEGGKIAFRVTARKAGKTTVTARILLKNKKKYKLTYKLISKEVIQKKSHLPIKMSIP